MDGNIGPQAGRNWKCARKILINNVKTIFTSSGQNTAELYDKHTF